VLCPRCPALLVEQRHRLLVTLVGSSFSVPRFDRNSSAVDPDLVRSLSLRRQNKEQRPSATERSAGVAVQGGYVDDQSQIQPERFEQVPKL
jgi:hypothetical protein